MVDYEKSCGCCRTLLGNMCVWVGGWVVCVYEWCVCVCVCVLPLLYSSVIQILAVIDSILALTDVILVILYHINNIYGDLILWVVEFCTVYNKFLKSNFSSTFSLIIVVALTIPVNIAVFYAAHKRVKPVILIVAAYVQVDRCPMLVAVRELRRFTPHVLVWDCRL